MSKWSLKLLEFAVRLYTRLNPRPGLSVGPLGFDMADPEVLYLDNGKRMIRVTIVHGPYWSDEDEVLNDTP